MIKRTNLFFLIAGILFINVAGFFLRYFNFDTYLILLGFRFHFSIVIWFLFALNYLDFSMVKEKFTHPTKQKFVPLLFIVLLPFLFVPLDMFVLKEFQLSEKDYFFELGLSSLIDYPIYLLWNTPQLLIFFISVNTVISNRKKFIKASLLAFSLFFFEIIPVEIINDINSYNMISYLNISVFILAVLLTGLLISRTENIYIFTVLLFSIFWAAVLFWGSSSSIINIFLASQYESWSGLVNPVRKFQYSAYLPTAYMLIIFLCSIIILKKNKPLPTS